MSRNELDRYGVKVKFNIKYFNLMSIAEQIRDSNSRNHNYPENNTTTQEVRFRWGTTICLTLRKTGGRRCVYIPKGKWYYHSTKSSI